MKRWNNYKIKLKSYILIKGSIIGLTNTNVFHLVLGGTYEVGILAEGARAPRVESSCFI
jgi:hypothetical protein